jgi:signal transduction histidine kinase
MRHYGSVMSRHRVARIADLVLVGLLVASAQVLVWTSEAWEGGRAVHAVLLALVTAPLAARHRRPLAVLLVVGLATWFQYQLGGDAPHPWFALLLAVYAVAADATRRTALAGAALAAVLLLSVDVPRLQDGDPLDEVLPGWALVAGVWLFGRWMRRRGRETRELAERAEVAERDREAAAARAVEEERARIARELHDLVAHSMGVIVIQAQAGQRSIDGDPTTARTALESIERVSRQGLGEMRRLLGLLTGTDAASVAPQPGLEQLEDLVGQVRAAGLAVELEVHGDLARVPAGVELAGYRIVQEALTNVLKHAAARTAWVRVRVDDRRLDVEVLDDGEGTSARGGTGRGHVGMRERAALYGGTVEAERLARGGFRVSAVLPLHEVPA